jgi:hypothetical protein
VFDALGPIPDITDDRVTLAVISTGKGTPSRIASDMSQCNIETYNDNSDMSLTVKAWLYAETLPVGCPEQL